MHSTLSALRVDKFLRMGGTMAALLALVAVSPAQATTTYQIIVDTQADEFDQMPNATCSLREAIKTVNEDGVPFGGCSTSPVEGTAPQIVLGAATYVITRHNNTDENANETNDFDLQRSVDIRGVSQASTIITSEGGHIERIMDVQANVLHGIAVITLRDLTIQGGNQASTASGMRNDLGDVTLLRVTVGPNTGRGIQNSINPMTLIDSRVTGNTDGGIESADRLTLIGTTVDANSRASGDGGGIYVYGGLTLRNSKVLNNTVTNYSGGGIYSQGSMDIRDSTIAGNQALESVSGQTARGGGIAAVGTYGGLVRIVNSTLHNNKAQANDAAGGGLYCTCTANLSNLLVSGNEARSDQGAARGGGLYLDAQMLGDITLKDSVIDGNGSAVAIGGFAPLSGGGLFADATLVSGITLSNNVATSFNWAEGGGAAISGGTVLTNSTVVGNYSDGRGGGISGEGKVVSSTITGNSSQFVGGGICSKRFATSPLQVQNSVIAGNQTPASHEPSPDCYGITSLGQVLIQDTTGCTMLNGPGDLLNVPANLKALAYNGGPAVGAANATVFATMLTREPESFSALIDAGEPSGCRDGNGVSLPLDQRGFVRTIDGPDPDAVATCDIGAIEYGSFEDLIFRNNFE